jgi:hypothetical protein
MEGDSKRPTLVSECCIQDLKRFSIWGALRDPVAAGFAGEGGLPLNRWTYMEGDNNRGKWGDWDKPEWLRYFEKALTDMSGDGKLDSVTGNILKAVHGNNKKDDPPLFVCCTTFRAAGSSSTRFTTSIYPGIRKTTARIRMRRPVTSSLRTTMSM